MRGRDGNMSNRAQLVVGQRYQLNSSFGSSFICLETLSTAYSAYSAKLQNVVSGWTFTAQGVNMYADGTIDWDFSTDGHFVK